MIASLPIIPGLQKRTPSELLSDVGTSLTSAFPIAIVDGLSFGPPVEHTHLSGLLAPQEILPAGPLLLGPFFLPQQSARTIQLPSSLETSLGKD